MRIKESFTLYRRKDPSGIVVFYYRTYTFDGKRTCGHSTGQTAKSAAREYCNKLLKEGRLLKAWLGVPTFEEFSKGWWDYETCEYLKKRKARRKISLGYARQGEIITRVHLVPEFGKKRLNEITTSMIDSWMVGFKARGLSNNTANIAVKILDTMLGEAIKRKLLDDNPCNAIELLPENKKEIEILTPEEVKKLFPPDWNSIWKNEIIYLTNKLAACSGMRIGELLGLRGEYLFDGYLTVCGQYSEKDGYVDTKSHKPRTIPLPTIIENDLGRLREINGLGYLFSEDGGKKPISRKRVTLGLKNALIQIGIDGDAQKKRHLVMHGWRHFFNTTLLMANVTDNKVMALTGHSSQQMKKRYTHLDATKFDEVVEVQNKVLEDKTKKENVAKEQKKSGAVHTKQTKVKKCLA
jgi:integrase